MNNVITLTCPNCGTTWNVRENDALSMGLDNKIWCQVCHHTHTVKDEMLPSIDLRDQFLDRDSDGNFLPNL